MINFLNPGYLYLLSFLIAPVIIHLLWRKRYNKIEFSNVKFVKKAADEFSYKVKLKNILLFIIRLFIIVLIVFYFAAPVNRKKGTLLYVKKYPVLLVIDNSYSMMYRDLEKTYLQKARENAYLFMSHILKENKADIIPALPAGKTKIVLSKDRDFLTDRLNKISVNSGTFRINNLIERIKNSGVDMPVNVMLFTDIQKITFENYKGDDDILLTLIDVSSHGMNSALLEVEPINSVVLPGLPVRFRIKLYNSDINKNLNLSGFYYTLDDSTPVKFMETEIESKDNIIQRNIDFNFIDTGPIKGFFKVGDDNLNMDNRYMFAVENIAKPELIYFNESHDSYTEMFLTTAGYKLKKENMQDIKKSLADKVNGVIFNGIKKFNNSEAAIIKKYVFDGGTAFFLTDENVNLVNYNDLLGKYYVNEESFLPAVLEKTETTEKYIENINLNYPFFKIFDRQTLIQLKDLKINSYIKITPYQKNQTLLFFADNIPGVLTKKMKKGRIVLFSYNHDSKYNNFYTSPLYYSIFNQIISSVLSSANITELKSRKLLTEKYRQSFNSEPDFNKRMFKTPEDEIVLFNFNSSESELDKTTNEKLNILNIEKINKEKIMEDTVVTFEKPVLLLLLLFAVLNLIISNIRI